MNAALKMLDGTVVIVPLPDPGKVDHITVGMIGAITAPEKGTVRTKVISITDDLVEFEEQPPEMFTGNPFGDPEMVPIVAHTVHVGAYEHPERPIAGKFEVVHLMGMCDFDPEESGPTIKFTAVIPLENRAMCNQMIAEIQRERDRAFPTPDGK